MPYRLLAVVGIGLLLVCGIAQAVSLSDFGTWDTATPSYTFNSTARWGTNWIDENNHHAGPATDLNSGGEWYDIEGLYLKVDQTTVPNHTILSWALITSHPGLEPGEWDGNLGHTPTPDNGTGFADQRNGANANGFYYHRNPVIGLDFDGNGTLEYGLVLDDHTTADMSNQKTGLDGLSGMTAAIYYVNDQSAWEDPWMEGVDFGHNVDIVTDPNRKVNGKDHLTTQLRTSTDTRREVGPYNELAWDDPGYSASNYKAMQGSYKQDRNYVWLGSMDVTLLGDIEVGATATSGMWCGNDWLSGKNLDHFDNSPELSTWALLGCTSLVGLFVMGWRRRRSA